MARRKSTLTRDVTLAAISPTTPFVVELAGGTQIDIPTPKYKLGYQREDLQLEAWRDEAGYLHKVEARRNLRRVNLEWGYLTEAQMRTIKTAFKSQEYFKLYYWDFEDGGSSVINEAYSGNLTYTLYTLSHNKGEYTDVKLAIIER